MASGYGSPASKAAVLAAGRDAFIERWVKSIGMHQEGGGGKRWRLPGLGKPKAKVRGRARLSAGGGSIYRRRVAVVTYHYRMAGQGRAKLHSHLRYIERPGAGEKAVTPNLIDGESDDVRGHLAVREWRDDRHHFRIILSPNDGGRLDMTAYTREYMAALEKALGTKLQWMASVHEKPDATHDLNRHAHIIVRGITEDGSDLVMSRDFILHEMKRIASDIATEHLGQMSQKEVDRYMERQAERKRNGERNYNAGHRPVRRKEMERE